MDKIIVVEDSILLSSIIRKSIEKETGLPVDQAAGYGEALELLAENQYFASVVDLNLPDAEKGIMVDVMVEKGIPVIVYTGDYSDEQREKIWKKKIVDYVLKNDPDSDQYISKTICQLRRNRDIDVLVTDDSPIMRNRIKKLLEAHLFRVHTCSNGKEGLELSEKLENLKIIISDYMMPEMDGFEYVSAVRKKFPKDKLAFIGLSGTQAESLSAKFIKLGASDFLMKPFSNEQFYTRISQNLQTILMIENIRELSFKDYLTGLYNRRYFFMEMDTLFDIEKVSTVAMIDIDFFKKVNDTYGHDGGDAVLKHISGMISKYFGKEGLAARFGGEEFCIFIKGNKNRDMFETFRKMTEDEIIDFNDEKISVTVSIGAAVSSGKSIDSMITLADELLYQSKNSGRNKVSFRD